jgi:ArsR family transcriptional regulator
MRQTARLAGALSDPTRLRILHALRTGELCVCQITALVGLAFSTVSRHMAVLHGAGMVESRKDGRWVYYRLAKGNTPPAIQDALKWALKHVRRTHQAKEDAVHLKKILKMEPEALCKRQNRR